MQPNSPSARAAIAALALGMLAPGCGLLPGGGEDVPPQTAAAPVETAAPTTTAASVDIVEVAESPLLEEDSLAGELLEPLGEGVADGDGSLEVLSIPEREVPTETIELPSAPPDPTECAQTAYGKWTVARLRDGSCWAYVRGVGWETGDEGEAPTFFGLVCSWVSDEQHKVNAWLWLPHVKDEVENFESRWWLWPLTRHASEWQDWEFAESAAPKTPADEGLLIGSLADDLPREIDEIGATEDPDSDATAQLPADISAARTLEGLARPEVHPSRVAFAPDDVVAALVLDDDASLERFGGIYLTSGPDTDPGADNASEPASEAERFSQHDDTARPFELWFEAIITPKSDEGEGDEEDEEAEERYERRAFPLSGAAEARRIVTGDCRRLNEPAGDDEAATSDEESQ